jgi:hypothetical protein
MAQPSEPHRRRNNNHISSFLQSTASNFLSLFNPPPLPPSPLPPSAVSLPLFLPPPLSVVTFDSTAESTRPSAKSVRVSRLNSNGKSGGGGPAFVGQVFSMCDLSGTGLMAVSTHFDIPFITKRFFFFFRNFIIPFVQFSFKI